MQDLQNVRLRRRSGMRALDLTTDLLASEAKHDRIKLRLTARIGYSSPEEIAEYVEHIGDRSGVDPLPLFRVHSARTPHTCKLSIADGWLFSGSGKLHGLASPAEGTATLTLEVDINPTRFLAHHAPYANLEALAALTPEEALTRNPEFERQARAVALDRNDNVLLGSGRQGGTWFEHRDCWWRQVVSVYLAHVQTLLRERLVPSVRNALPRVHVTALEFQAVAQAECYWEQERRDAISVMMSLADRLRTASGQYRLRYHLPEVHRIDEAQEQNCLSITLHLTQEIQFCLYAKTCDRLRFEVRYLSNVRDNIARRFRGSADIPAILLQAREDAARRMIKIFEALANVMAPADFDRERLLDMMDALLWATEGDRAAARRLLSPLINLEAVSETLPGGIAPPEVLRRLEHREVIHRVRVRHGGVPRYALTPPYAAVRRALIEALPDRRALAEEGAAAPPH